MSWRKAITKSEAGQVGQVYYFNIELINNDGHEPMYFTQPFTLNPDQGKTLEDVLRASKEIPQDLKSSLLSKRKAEAYLTNGSFLKIWISEEQVPQELRTFNTPSKEKTTPSGLIY